uniref:mediator of DNA damage checkpoint protein 1 n=1 Tax=Solea senegalensis TaxID=28829 RepID=UPI001CD8FFBF|nr:mediator of DNA damage checkpoint protein 1 [Solea senegalensis]
MAVTYRAVTHLDLLSQQYPPPLLPKPGKDNVRLQKLLKRTAKKKASTQATQSAAPFRSSLSPVNEASPDLEHSDHSTPPRTPETPFNYYSRVQQPPRFSVRPLYQHVASPYPQRAAYGRAARFSPQPVAIPSYAQQVTSASSYSALSPAPGPVDHSAVPKISLLDYSVPTVASAAAEVKKPAFSTSLKSTSPGLAPYQAAGGQAYLRPLTVLTPLIKPKSPRPTFRATEPSRSPRPMFDVPQIRMYTASTSFYESSRTPPVYDTAELTAIGSTVPQKKIQTGTKLDLTPLYEVREGTAAISQPPNLGTDLLSKPPISEVKRNTTPTAGIDIAPAPEIKRATPTPEIQRATPTSETRAKTPTYEFQTSKTAMGRPRTPAYHVTRAATPVFEISRPNPLLFAVSPMTVEPEKSHMQTIASDMSSLSATQCETLPNGDILSEVTPQTQPIQQSISKAKSEPVIISEKNKTALADSQRATTPTFEPTTPVATSYTKTPTYEATRLLTASPGYKRPKTPTGVSPVAFKRPRTPTQVSQTSKSGYRGLTPAEYAAYGGIRTYSPAFGISRTTEEVVKVTEEGSAESKLMSQGHSMTAPSIAGVSQVKEDPKDEDKPRLREEKVPTTPAIPIIVVSQASDTSGTTLTRETSTVFSHVTVKQEKTQTLERVEPQVQKAVKTKTPETKHPPPKDPMMAVRKLFGKDTVQADKQKAGTVGKTDASEAKKPVTSTMTKAEGSKPTPAAPALPTDTPAAQSKPNEKKEQDKEAEPAVKSALEKKEGGESAPAAEPLLKVLQKPKGMKSKVSGWSRLKKHMVVEQEEPKFPEISPNETTGQDQKEVKKTDESTEDASDKNQNKGAAMATKMWDAVLFQMFSTKENIMHQIELSKSEKETTTETKEETKDIPSFAFRLPLLLFSPKFNAKKLKEAASKPVTKKFEMGLIGRKGKEEEPKDFNRTARGFTST